MRNHSPLRACLMATAWLGLFGCLSWAGLAAFTGHPAQANSLAAPSNTNATSQPRLSPATSAIPSQAPAASNPTPVSNDTATNKSTVPAAPPEGSTSNATISTAQNATTAAASLSPAGTASNATEGTASNATVGAATGTVPPQLPATNNTSQTAFPLVGNATGQYTLDPAWLPLIGRLEADGFPREKMEPLFTSLGEGSYSPAFMGAKVAELRGVYGVGIRPLPYEMELTPEGYVQPLQDSTALQCRAFLAAHAKSLDAIRKQYGVSSDIIMGVLLVETGVGMNLGQTSALRALGSMAATTTPAMLSSKGNAAQAKRVPASILAGILKNKSDWAYAELKALIRYGERYGYACAGLPGSVYGAIGLCQFMPSNIELFGVDGDEDGKIDLFSVADALHSVARYLENSGWRGAQTPEKKIAVIRQYNDDGVYAQMVLAVANQVARATAGKIKDGVNLLGAAYPMAGRYIDPSIRRFRGRVPAAARVKSLGDYSSILQGGE